MSPLRAAAILVFSLALLAPEGLALLQTPDKKKATHIHHHKGHHHHKVEASSSAAAPVTAVAQTKKVKKGIEKDELANIQKELVEAWKHKSHMAKLRQTLDAEQKLLTSQQSLVESEVDDASISAERQQVSATQSMINDAKVLLHHSRQDALKKTREALKEAYQIKKAAEHDIEESTAAIARATKARKEAEEKKEKIVQVVHAATAEAKFFFNQAVPEVEEEVKEKGLEAKSSSTPIKNVKQTVSAAETQKPAAPKPKQAELKLLKEQTQKKSDAAREEDEEKVRLMLDNEFGERKSAGH